MSDEHTNEHGQSGNPPEQVGRVDLEQAFGTHVDSTPDNGKDNLGAIIIGGVIAILLMVGALLLILPGVFGM